MTIDITLDGSPLQIELDSPVLDLALESPVLAFDIEPPPSLDFELETTQLDFELKVPQLVLPVTAIETGVPGPAGPPGPPGVGQPGQDGVSFIWVGAWNIAAGYLPNEVVARNGASYICLHPNTNSDPATDSYNWNLMAAAGVQGLPGSKWYDGPADPVTVPGSHTGDYYLNDTSGGVFTLQ
jgi:hypothetical protein